MIWVNSDEELSRAIFLCELETRWDSGGWKDEGQWVQIIPVIVKVMEVCNGSAANCIALDWVLALYHACRDR